MNKFKQSAIAILQGAKEPLHYKEITKRAIEEGILETDGATPDASMNAQISVEIKNRGMKSSFIRTGPGTYSLNPDTDVSPEEDEIVEEEIAQVQLPSSFTGSAGEYLVCSELLFRGFNASIMSVDTGIDIAATKDDKLYSVQVKTANLNKYKTYVFDVRKVSFERHSGGNIYYIFVLRGKKTNFILLPYHEVNRKVHEKAILEVGHGKRYRVNIKFRNNKVFLGSMEHDISYYLNNWDIIE